MSMGSMERGKRRMLKRERATNAFSAVSRLFGSLRLTRAYVAKVARDTCERVCVCDKRERE